MKNAKEMKGAEAMAAVGTLTHRLHALRSGLACSDLLRSGPIWACDGGGLKNAGEERSRGDGGGGLWFSDGG